MTDVPKIDTQAPERIWTYSQAGCEGIQGQWRPIDMSRMYGPMVEYVRRDLADARAAAAWQAGIDALLDRVGDLPISEIAADEVIYAAKKLTPPADGQAALDRLIAERVREAIQPIKEAWDWWQADSYDRDASVVVDAIDEAMNAARGSKEGQP